VPHAYDLTHGVSECANALISRSPPPAPSTGAAVTATSGETLDTLPLPPEQVCSSPWPAPWAAAQHTNVLPCSWCEHVMAPRSPRQSLLQPERILGHGWLMEHQPRLQLCSAYCHGVILFAHDMSMAHPLRLEHWPLVRCAPTCIAVRAQTAGRRSVSDPVPEPSEDPQPMSHSTSAAGLSTRSGATGQSECLAAAPSASGSLPSEFGRLAIESPSATPKAAEGQPAAHSSAASPGAGAAQGASAADAAPARGPSGREAAAAEVADSGAAERPAQSSCAEEQEGGAPAAAASADDEGGGAEPRDAEEEKGPPAGGQQAQREGQRAGDSKGPGPQDEAVSQTANGIEAEHSPEWQRQPKHVFVLTSAGARL